MNLFREKALIQSIAEQYRLLDAGDVAEFTQEEAEFAGAFLEDAIGFEDVDLLNEGGRHEQH